ncbi:hypothetical protein [Trinickia mobilis]|uniref:hypothetical protein n=1 Tax=Trinickia mobilis TaxID=2816356 RepID=UPI001A8FB850|nr:hypothetical protein [Trinickia mobilis]
MQINRDEGMRDVTALLKGLRVDLPITLEKLAFVAGRMHEAGLILEGLAEAFPDDREIMQWLDDVASCQVGTFEAAKVVAAQELAAAGGVLH